MAEAKMQHRSKNNSVHFVKIKLALGKFCVDVGKKA